jgi:hypothetical protein
MNDSEKGVPEWDRALERLAAEAAAAAYSVALRHGAGGSWLDLELGLWKALARTVREWDRPATGPPSRGVSSSRAERIAPSPGE